MESYQPEIYQATGCYLCPSCLECPFPDCILDKIDSILLELRKIEARELARQGNSVNKIADTLGVSIYTIKRYLSKEALTT